MAIPLSHDFLLSSLAYDPMSGIFTRKLALPGTAAGTIAGYKARAWVAISVGGKVYPAHRLAWFYMTKSWPADMVDHANGDPFDNAWANLRLADNSLNQANRRLSNKSTSGRKGVSRHISGKWQASIKVRGRNIYLGLFEDLDAAHAAYLEAAKEHFGSFARPS